MSNRERTIVVGGLIGGLLLGGLLLKGGVSSDKPDPSPNVAHAPTTPGGAAANRSDDIQRLREKVAELEKEQLERRVAELEAETTASESADERDAPSPAAVLMPKHRPSIESLSDLTADNVPSPVAKTVAGTHSPKSAQREKAPAGPATLVYWNGLNDIIARESAMRAPPASVTAANAGEFVQARLKAGRYASAAIRDLDATGVDRDAVALGRELTEWYQEEVTLNERATSLLGSASVAERKGAAGNSWRGGEEQHRKKCDDINRHGADLRARLSRKYNLNFPPLN